jgi:hypothetical protein
MMGGAAFILLKAGLSGPETVKQAEIRLAGLLKILDIGQFGVLRFHFLTGFFKLTRKKAPVPDPLYGLIFRFRLQFNRLAAIR